MAAATSAYRNSQFRKTLIQPTFQCSHHRSRYSRGMPVHAHHASESLKPEGIAKPGKKFGSSIGYYDVLGYRRSEHGHTVCEPGGHTTAMQRQIGSAGSLHNNIMNLPLRITN